jgi:transcriptional regulator with XRE-family HTH domain
MDSHYCTPQSRNTILRDSNIAPFPYSLRMGFKERLTEARKAKKLSQEALGQALGGMSKQTISHWENGRYEPSVVQLQRLCEVLDCTADWLILNKSPGKLGPDALDQAKFYDGLSDGAKKRWKAMRMLIVDAASDKTVEKRMPITKKKEVPQ